MRMVSRTVRVTVSVSVHHVGDGAGVLTARPGGECDGGGHAGQCRGALPHALLPVRFRSWMIECVSRRVTGYRGPDSDVVSGALERGLGKLHHDGHAVEGAQQVHGAAVRLVELGLPGVDHAARALRTERRRLGRGPDHRERPARGAPVRDDAEELLEVDVERVVARPGEQLHLGGAGAGGEVGVDVPQHVGGGLGDAVVGSDGGGRDGAEHGHPLSAPLQVVELELQHQVFHRVAGVVDLDLVERVGIEARRRRPRRRDRRLRGHHDGDAVFAAAGKGVDVVDVQPRAQLHLGRVLVVRSHRLANPQHSCREQHGDSQTRGRPVGRSKLSHHVLRCAPVSAPPGAGCPAGCCSPAQRIGRGSGNLRAPRGAEPLFILLYAERSGTGSSTPDPAADPTPPKRDTPAPAIKRGAGYACSERYAATVRMATSAPSVAGLSKARSAPKHRTVCASKPVFHAVGVTCPAIPSIMEWADGSQDRASGGAIDTLLCAPDAHPPIHTLSQKTRMALPHSICFPFPTPLQKHMPRRHPHLHPTPGNPASPP